MMPVRYSQWKRSLGAMLVACIGVTFFETIAWAQTGEGSRWDQGIARLDAAALFGDRPGADLDGHRLGGFVPLRENQPSLLFLDGSVFLNEDSSDFSGDIGLGYRQSVCDTVYGGNVYYHYREASIGSSSFDFSTLGFGLEALSRDWSLRANAFFSLEGSESFESGVPSGTSRILRVAESLDGAELTLIRKLPSLFSDIGGGIYFLDADDDTFGGQVTVDCSLTESTAAHLIVSHDDLFDTSVLGAVSFYFGGPRINSRPCGTKGGSRLWSRVRRRRVAPVLKTETVINVDPPTGLVPST